MLWGYCRWPRGDIQEVPIRSAPEDIAREESRQKDRCSHTDSRPGEGVVSGALQFKRENEKEKDDKRGGGKQALDRTGDQASHWDRRSHIGGHWPSVCPLSSMSSVTGTTDKRVGYGSVTSTR